ncbi:MAG: DUF1295 domain-containing protein [Bacteroidales bacterium]|nr:DUF1295 domain-containing protein [Bacteroidales bacterium]
MMLYAWIGIAILIFPLLLKVTAPYGKHAKSTWGPMINNRIGWFIMELPALLVFAIFFLKGVNKISVVSALFFILWVSHYCYRSIVFPLRIKTDKKKMPLLIVIFAICFNCINGFLNGYWFGNLSDVYALSRIWDVRFISGFVLFFSGFAIHHYHDQILILIRQDNPDAYQIPKGGLFRFISCPNFLGEIVEWAGFALLTWCLPAFSFFLWTFVNLVPRALDHHRWYKRKFENYPTDRKAIFPFLL